MSYEQMRSTLSARLVDRLPAELLHDVLHELDAIANNYEVRRACTDLITASADPEILKIYVASLIVENRSKGTIKGYHSELQHFFEAVRKPYNMVTTNDIRLYLSWRQQNGHLQKSSTEHVRIIINAFFAWLVDEEYIDRNPARKIEPIRVDKKGREPIPSIELENIRLACQDLREKALIDFLFSSGCRVSECAALTLDDIDFRDRSVKIRHGKGDKFRITYFNAEAEASLRRYLDSRQHESKALFSSRRAPYGNVTSTSLEADVRKIRARVPNLSVEVVPHALRTTFATTAAGNGMPLQLLQQLMGHSNINTTMRYVKNSQAETMANHRKFVT